MSQYQILSKDYLLRKKANNKYILYNKRKSVVYTISPKLFNFLYLYKEGNFNLDIMLQYLSKQGIAIDDLVEFINNKDFSEIFIPVSKMEKVDSIYKYIPHISSYTEYTPERIDFLITKHCNLKCKHCFENASPTIKNGKIALEDLFNVFNQMDLLNVRTLKITGGEPLTYPNIKDILKEISNKRFECIILTNAMLLDEELIDIISEGAIKLGISLDGYKKQSHDFLRGKGAFDILMQKLYELKKAKANVSITMSVNRINYLEIEELSKFAIEELGVQRVFINQLKPLGRAKTNDNIFLSDTEYKDVINRVEKLVNLYGNGKITLSDDALLSEEYTIKNDAPISNDTPLVCAAGNNSISIDENLDVYPCVYGNGFSEFNMGNLKTESLSDIWLSDKWSIFRGKTTLGEIEGCKDCKNNKICGMKNCRLKPIYNGQSFYTHVSYCNKK